MRLKRVILVYEDDAEESRTITVERDGVEFPDSKPYPREVKLAQETYERFEPELKGERR